MKNLVLGVGEENRPVTKKPGGDTDDFENTRLTEKGIRKILKTDNLQIDGREGAIRKLLKRKVRLNRRRQGLLELM